MLHSMSFYWSSDIGDFFFKGLTISTTTSFTLLCLVLVLFSITYEAMKVHSAKVRARAARERLRSSSCAPSETANLLANDQNRRNRIVCSRKIFQLVGEAFVFLLHNTLGYALMLSVMIYNGYLFLMVVFGMGLGYFLFGHISMRVNMENMQARTTKVICSPACPEESTSGGTSGTSSHFANSGHCNQLSGSTSSSTILHHIQENSSSNSLNEGNGTITDSCRL